jgi:hypothetical protein
MFDCKQLCKCDDGKLYLKIMGKLHKVRSIYIHKTTPGRYSRRVVRVPKMFGKVISILDKMAGWNNINTHKIFMQNDMSVKALHVPLHVPCWNNIKLRNGKFIRDRVVKVELHA